MNDTAGVRKSNTHAIRKILWSGNACTKQSAARMTGLSVATCNTILNDLAAAGEVTGIKERLQEVGRSTTVFRINDAYEQVLCLEYRLIQGERSLSYAVCSMAGAVMEQKRIRLATVKYAAIAKIVRELVARFPGISVISVGTPSIAQHGIVRHCDIPELEGEPIVEKLGAQFGRPVILENDMLFKAYGYYKKECGDRDIVTLVNFPANILPGTATILAGHIVKGVNGFAGMTGFLPHGVDRAEEIRLLTPERYLPFALRSVTAIIVMLNPGEIVLSGDLLNERELKKIDAGCRETIPAEYMPKFRHVADFDGYFLEGMFQLALDRKGELLS